jgi:hypothetical protein
MLTEEMLLPRLISISSLSRIELIQMIHMNKTIRISTDERIRIDSSIFGHVGRVSNRIDVDDVAKCISPGPGI